VVLGKTYNTGLEANIWSSEHIPVGEGCISNVFLKTAQEPLKGRLQEPHQISLKYHLGKGNQYRKGKYQLGKGDTS